MWKPCGAANTPSPQLSRSSPSGLNFTTGGSSSRPTQVAAPGGWLLKQRWKTQMFPSASRSTPMVSPHRPPFMCAGRFGHSSTRRYGLGSGCAAAPAVAPMRTATTRVMRTEG